MGSTSARGRLQGDHGRATARERVPSVRAKVEHPFRVVKKQFGYAKMRYRGLAKNTARLTLLFSLSNLWMARRQVLGPRDECVCDAPEGHRRGRIHALHAAQSAQ